MKCRLFDDDTDATKAVREKTVDIAVVESGNTGVTTFYLLFETEVPAALQKLPGYRHVGVEGIPGAPVHYHSCRRTAAEVMTAIG